MKVCIIGAGAAGLVMLKYLTAKKEMFSVVVYEQTSSIGGTWVYTDSVGVDERGIPVHTSMYQNLRTNSPRETMTFDDFPYPDHLPSFIGHEDVLNYMHAFLDKFHLLQYIQFNTKVTQIVENPGNGSRKWTVKTTSLPEGFEAKEDNDEFDAVVVCSGHHSDPYVPAVPGLNTFPGAVLHSHDYRIPERFKGQKVLSVGSGLSGGDIAMEISQQAEKVFMSYRTTPNKSILPDNVTQVPRVQSIAGRKVTFIDGTQLNDEIDSIIFNTGYKYTFPFLDSSCHPIVIGNMVKPLYKQIFHIEHGTTLSFIGLNGNLLPMLQIITQAKFVFAGLVGSMKLPLKQEMYSELVTFYADGNNIIATDAEPVTKAVMPWDYYDQLTDLASVERLPRVFPKIHTDIFHGIINNILEFRKMKYIVVNNEEFVKKNVNQNECS